jgi:hypothetical protein
MSVPLILSDLAGTLRDALRVAKATLDASALTASRTYTLPDKSGTLATTDDVAVGGVSLAAVRNVAVMRAY